MLGNRFQCHAAPPARGMFLFSRDDLFLAWQDGLLVRLKARKYCSSKSQACLSIYQGMPAALNLPASAHVAQCSLLSEAIAVEEL